jgi:hypothetical protein
VSSLTGNMAAFDTESLTELTHRQKPLLYKFIVIMVQNIANKLILTHEKHAS